jgi:hypothetical protein
VTRVDGGNSLGNLAAVLVVEVDLLGRQRHVGGRIVAAGVHDQQLLPRLERLEHLEQPALAVHWQ